MRSSRRFSPAGRNRRLWAAVQVIAVLVLAAAVGFALAVVAHGGSTGEGATLVVQPGDTLWSIAAERYPTDDVRARVLDIEQANGLSSPLIVVGETLRLPA